MFFLSLSVWNGFHLESSSLFLSLYRTWDGEYLCQPPIIGSWMWLNLKEQTLQSVFVEFPVWERTFQRVHEGPPTKWIFECIFERIGDVRNIKKISHLYIERGFCFGSERSAVPVNLLWLLPRCDKEFPWTLIAKYNANNVIIRSSVYKERTTVFHITKHLVS